MAKPATSKKHTMNRRQRERSRGLLLERDGDLCHWCGRPFTDDDWATLEHLVPRSQYGRNALWNLVLAHRSCNNARGQLVEGPRLAEQG